MICFFELDLLLEFVGQHDPIKPKNLLKIDKKLFPIPLKVSEKKLGHIRYYGQKWIISREIWVEIS